MPLVPGKHSLACSDQPLNGNQPSGDPFYNLVTEAISLVLVGFTNGLPVVGRKQLWHTSRLPVNGLPGNLFRERSKYGRHEDTTEDSAQSTNRKCQRTCVCPRTQRALQWVPAVVQGKWVTVTVVTDVLNQNAYSDPSLATFIYLHNFLFYNT